MPGHTNKEPPVLEGGSAKLLFEFKVTLVIN